MFSLSQNFGILVTVGVLHGSQRQVDVFPESANPAGTMGLHLEMRACEKETAGPASSKLRFNLHLMCTIRSSVRGEAPSVAKLNVMALVSNLKY